jgi:hypothetical protein
MNRHVGVTSEKEWTMKKVALGVLGAMVWLTMAAACGGGGGSEGAGSGPTCTVSIGNFGCGVDSDCCGGGHCLATTDGTNGCFACSASTQCNGGKCCDSVNYDCEAAPSANGCL